MSHLFRLLTPSHSRCSVPLSCLSVDEMGGRIDDLEKSIGELMAQAGIEEEADKASAKPAAAAAPAAAAPAAE